MKIKIIQLLTFIAFQFSIQSQSIFESFDDYNVGDNVGEVSPNFDAWDFDSSVDTKVTDIKSFSGENAIRIFRDGNYASDLQFTLVDEPTPYGVFEFKTQMLIQPGGKGYLRLDSSTEFNATEHFTVICEYGDCTLVRKRDYGVSSNNNARNKINMGYPYNENEWFQIEITMYRGKKINTYSLKVNGECIGQFSIQIGDRIGSINFFAIDGADYYLDDVSFVKTEEEYIAESHTHVMNLNNRIFGAQGGNLSINGGIIFANAFPFETISNYTIELDIDGVKTEYEILQHLEDKRFDYFCIDPGIQFDINAIVSARLSEIEGTPLEPNNIKCENGTRVYFNTISRERQKQVFVEGFVNNKEAFDVNTENDLSFLQEQFPDHVSAVSVHRSGADPFNNQFDYFSNLGGVFPVGNTGAVAFEKTEQFVNHNLQEEVITRIYQPAILKIRNIATLENDLLEVMVELEAFENVSSGSDIAVIITEDSVQGEGEEYDLANIFADDNNDSVFSNCEYADKPAVVPAAEVFYDRIPRAVEVQEITEQINAGEKSIYTFEIDATSIGDISNYKIISVVRNASGMVENSNTSTLQEALDSEDFSTNVNDINAQPSSFLVRTIDVDNLLIAFPEAGNYNIIISNLQGQVITSASNITSISKNIDTSAFARGLYIITVEDENRVESKMIVNR